MDHRELYLLHKWYLFHTELHTYAFKIAKQRIVGFFKIGGTDVLRMRIETLKHAINSCGFKFFITYGIYVILFYIIITSLILSCCLMPGFTIRPIKIPPMSAKAIIIGRYTTNRLFFCSIIRCLSKHQQC